MGTVKYTGPVASFHCPTNAEIRSLKVHFSPKQEGSGDPSPENVREIVGWDGVVVHNDRDGIMIPEEYQKVEYISGTSNVKGTNFIDTGIPMTANTVVELIFAWNLDTNAQYDRLGGFGSCEWIEAANGAEDITLRGRGTATMVKRGQHTLILTGNSWSVDNKQISTYSISTFVDSNIILFSNTLGAYADRDGRWSIYSCKIYENSNLILHYVPCRRKSDNEPGMYDIITQTFFTNQGTGEFICGPNVGQTTNYEFGVLGKNKLSDNLEDYTLLNASADTIFSNGSFSGTVTEGQRDVAVCKINTKYPAGTYTLSYDYINNVGNTNWRPVSISKYNDGSWYDSLISTNSATENSGHYTKTFTTDEDFYVHLTLNCFASASVTAINSISNLQLELGSTATAYEPYDPKHTVYGGWVDLISGEVCEEYHKWIITPDNFTLNNVYTGGICFEKRLDTMPSPNGVMTEQKFTHGTIINPYSRNTGCNAFAYSAGGHKVRIGFSDSYNLSSVEDFYNWLNLQTDEVAVTYKTNSPNTYQLHSTELQTFLGQNNVWSNADYVEVEYDLHETQNILARKQFIMANQPHIVTPAAAPLQNFITDVPAPLKECKVHFAPVQDLHGYSNPWPAGGGKNIAKPYDNSYVSSTYVSFDYSAANGTFRCYGTASASSTHSSPSATNAVNNGATFTLPAGTYTLSIIDGDGASIYAQCVSSDETVLAETTSYITFTTNESLTVFVRLKVAAAATVDKTVKIQLEKGSSATAYVPYENICPISGWNSIQVGLPSEYQRVEYLENQNTAYIMTDYFSDMVSRVDIDFYYVQERTWANLVGASDSQTDPRGSGILLTHSNSLKLSTYYSTSTIVASKLETNKRYKISGIFKSGNQKLLINNVVIGTNNVTYTQSVPHMSIFSLYYGSQTNKSNERALVKIYSCQFYTGENEQLLANFIPCIRKADNKPGLYETIHNIFYTNAGGGEFICGPNVEEQSLLIDWTTEAGTVYGGYVDLVTGEVVATEGHITFDGSQDEPWIPNGTDGYYFNQTLPNGNTTHLIMCDHYKAVANKSTHYMSEGECNMNGNGALCQIFDTSATTTADFKAKLAQSPVSIIYQLTTPIHHALTPTQLKTLRGINNIWSNANGNIELSYWKH